MTKQARSVSEAAEILGRRRTRFFAVQIVLFTAWQTAWSASWFQGPATRSVDRVQGLTWLVWASVLLAMLARGTFLTTAKAVREYMNDELVRFNRQDALAWGFWSAMGVAIVYYAIAMFDVIPLPLALHSIVSAGIGVALGRFVVLERRGEHGE